MSKFTKRMLIASGWFLGAGVILAIVGCIGGAASGAAGNAGVLYEMGSTLEKWHIHILPFHGTSGIWIEDYDMEYDKDYDVAYGTFTDEDIRDTDIWNLDIEIGAGELRIEEGDRFKLEKEGDLSCQYYVKEDTFYLKQKGSVHNKKEASLILTIPTGMELEGVSISVGAGSVSGKGKLKAEKMEIEVGAGEAVLEEADAGEFNAEIGAGELTVHTLHARDCETEVSMGSIFVGAGTVSRNLDADVSMGEITFHLSDSYDDHSYMADCAMGEILIKNGEEKKTYNGLGNTMELSGKNATDSKYELNCAMGSILLSFDKS